MAMAIRLTSNAIESICKGEMDGNPVVQVVDIKLVTSAQQNNAERYRMLLSDGVHLQQGMLSTQMNQLVRDQRLQKGSVVQLSQFVSQVVQQRKIIIIVELDVILEKCEPIGDPKMFGHGGNGPASSLAPQVRTSVPEHSSRVYPGATPAVPVSHASSTISAPLQSGSLSSPNVIGRAILQSPNSDLGPTNVLQSSTSRSYSDRNRNFSSSIQEGGLRVSSNTYGRPLQQTYQQSLNRGPTFKSEMTARIVPIASLNPYMNKWTIKARVTSKKDLRSYTNARGEGKVFSFDLLDSDGGEIQVTCFNAVADQFYSMIEAGSVYFISAGTVRPASKNFNHLNNDYSIYLESTSTVQPCLEEDSSIPRQQFHFRPIGDIENMGNNSILDVIGVVSSVTPTASIMKKDGSETQKRSLQLKDMSGRSVELTLWGDFCTREGQKLQNMCDSGVFPVMAVKGGRISDFNGKSVGTLSSSQLCIEPEFPEALMLREWFDTEGKDKPAVSISRGTVGMGAMDVRKTVSQIKDESLGTSEKPDWIIVHATISYIKLDNFFYTACALVREGRPCSKKVTSEGDGKWRCEKCDQSSAECDYRYILSFQIQDHTGLTWVTAFQECGEEIFGVSAKDLYLIKNEEQDDEKFAEIIRGVLFTQYLFKLKVKEETYSDEQRVKCTVVKADKVDVSSESRFLLNMLGKFAEDLNASVGRTSNGAMKSELGAKEAAYGMNIVGNIPANRENGLPADYVGQNRNQYNSGTEPAVAGAGVYLRCSSCGGTGHNSKNCPRVVNRASPAVGSGSAGDCYKCHQSGHWARDCQGSGAIAGRYGGISMQRG